MFLYDLLINCHYKYFAISFNILVWSYVSTVLFLKYKHSLSWKKSLLYPHYHGKNLMKKLFISFQGKELPNVTTDELLLAHNIGPNHLLMKIKYASMLFYKFSIDFYNVWFSGIPTSGLSHFMILRYFCLFYIHGRFSQRKQLSALGKPALKSKRKVNK